MDYCNSILYGLPKQEHYKLQRIKKTTARLITRTKRYEHIKPALRELHWLPVESRIIFKVLLINFKIIRGLFPAYLSSLPQRYHPQRSLHSSSKLLFTGPTVNSVTYGQPKHILYSLRLVCVVNMHCFPNKKRYLMKTWKVCRLKSTAATQTVLIRQARAGFWILILCSGLP